VAASPVWTCDDRPVIELRTEIGERLASRTLELVETASESHHEDAAEGLDAVNFGPGDPDLARRDDERIETTALVRSYEVLRAFVSGRP